MDGIHPEVAAWIRRHCFGEVSRSIPVYGGCIHRAKIIFTDSGESFFLKQNPSVPADTFFCEAEGLEALQIAGGPVVPEVLLAGEGYLLLEDLQPAPRCEGFWAIYGHQLALVHSRCGTRFGFSRDNYIGSSPQLNGWLDDGYEFYRERRFLPQIAWARDRGLLDCDDVASLEGLLRRMDGLFPLQPASLLHGDLWSGNLTTDQNGLPALIDPAVYFGWAEADLAMTDLFGSYPEKFYRSYQEIRPLEDGYRSRYPLYNLYHLLNHLNLFGGSYLEGIQAVISRYC